MCSEAIIPVSLSAYTLFLLLALVPAEKDIWQSGLQLQLLTGLFSLLLLTISIAHIRPEPLISPRHSCLRIFVKKRGWIKSIFLLVHQLLKTWLKASPNHFSTAHQLLIGNDLHLVCFKIFFEIIGSGITSRTVSPIAQATGFPPKVEKYPPSRSDTSLVERFWF